MSIIYHNGILANRYIDRKYRNAVSGQLKIESSMLTATKIPEFRDRGQSSFEPFYSKDRHHSHMLGLHLDTIPKFNTMKYGNIASDSGVL